MIKFVLCTGTMNTFQEDSTTTDTGIVLQKLPVEYPSLLSEQRAPGDTDPGLLPERDHPAWLPAMLLLSLILLAWGKFFFRRRLSLILRAVAARNYANQLIREGNIFYERIGLVLFLVYIISMSLFVYLGIPVLAEAGLAIETPIPFLMIVGFFPAFWLLKVLYVHVLSALFKTGSHSGEMLVSMYIYNLFTGIVLLPLLACMAYADARLFFYITLIIIILIYFFRLLRAFVIGIRLTKFSLFHLFLYLCTLEILPMIVLAKIFTRNMIL